ncbi:hypothetical protein F5Y15DRAFT_414608 [Xylariaceae sp. FL0016]|nr:hypothetical protein F5Y15DRAFT_414608 [Xylariaceae sp. FL0016]
MSVIETLYHTPGSHPPHHLEQKDFERLMSHLGFSVERGAAGSRVKFTPHGLGAFVPNGVMTSYTLHEPHGKGKKDANHISKARRMGEDLSKLYGWSPDMFEEA